MKVGDIVSEPIKVHGIEANSTRRAARVRELLSVCGLNPRFADRYPHEMSGGQRQRVGIARALALEPEFIVCDEAVSALDVSIQAQVVNLLEDLREQFGLTYLFIAHDLSVVRHLCQRVAVMYLGRIVELADSDELFGNPLHPYTQALLAAVPVPDPSVEAHRSFRPVQGEVPSPINPPSGCVFHPRCPIAVQSCKQARPELREHAPGHFAAWAKCDDRRTSADDCANCRHGQYQQERTQEAWTPKGGSNMRSALPATWLAAIITAGPAVAANTGEMDAEARRHSDLHDPGGCATDTGWAPRSDLRIGARGRAVLQRADAGQPGEPVRHDAIRLRSLHWAPDTNG